MEFLEIPIFDDDVYKLGVRFLLNAIFLFLLLWFAIRPSIREREFAFSVVMMNITVFFICFTLKKLDLGLGMALGLFAIFGILRYRADAIRTKDMTYLFIAIGIAVINSLSNRKTSYVELALVNFVILGMAMLKESKLIPYPTSSVAEIQSSEPKKKTKKSNAEAPDCNGNKQKYVIKYDRLEWLGSNDQQNVINDLKQRTGLDVARFKVQDIDLTKKSATLTVWTDNAPADSKPSLTDH